MCSESSANPTKLPSVASSASPVSDTTHTMSDSTAENKNGAATSAASSDAATSSASDPAAAAQASVSDAMDVAKENGGASEAQTSSASSGGDDAAEASIALTDKQREVLTQWGLPAEDVMSFAKTYDELEKKIGENEGAQRALGIMADAFAKVREAACEKGSEADSLRKRLEAIKGYEEAREAETFTTVVNSARNSMTENEFAKNNADLAKISSEDFDHLMGAYQALPDPNHRRSLAKALTWTALNCKSTDAQICNSRAQLEQRASSSQQTEKEKQRLQNRRKYLDAILNVRTDRTAAVSDPTCGMSSHSTDLLAAIAGPSYGYAMSVNSMDPRSRFEGVADSKRPAVGSKRSHEEASQDDAQPSKDSTAKKTPGSFLDSFIAGLGKI